MTDEAERRRGEEGSGEPSGAAEEERDLPNLGIGSEAAAAGSTRVCKRPSAATGAREWCAECTIVLVL